MKGRLAVAALAALGAPASPAHAAQQDTPQAPVRVGIVKAASSVDDVLARAAREAHYLVFAAAADLAILIRSFRQEVRGRLDAPPSRLPPPERQRLEEILEAVADLQQAAGEPRGQAHETLANVKRLMAMATPAVGEAQVTGAGPPVLSPPPTDEVRFTVRGLGLRKSAPRLFLGSTEATRVMLGARQAVFSIPAQALGFHDTAPGVRSGRILLTARQCTLWVFCKGVPQEYPVSLLLLPRRLATVEITYHRTLNQRVYDKTPAANGPPTDKLYSRDFDYSNNDLTLLACTTDAQAPHAAGYLIDPASLSLTVKSSAGQTRSRITAATPKGFTVELCAQAQISHLIKTSGAISVQATWKEYQMADVVQPAESLPAQPLTWGSPIQASLPPGTSAIAVHVDYFDGAHATYTGDATDDLVQLTWDRAHQRLHLAARDPADIEGID